MDDNIDNTVKGTHDKYTDAYVNILDTYRTQIDSSVTKKNGLKEYFFTAIKHIMYALTFLFITTIIGSFILFGLMIKFNYQSVSVITGSVSAIISSFVTMVLSIFKLPEIIANYLFNKEEDKLMSDIIKNIQTYELSAVKHDIEKAKLERIKQLNQETVIVSEDSNDTDLISSSYDSSPGDEIDVDVHENDNVS